MSEREIKKEDLCEMFKRTRFKGFPEELANKYGCPDCEENARVTGMGGGVSTCPTCGLCFKYHHD